MDDPTIPTARLMQGYQFLKRYDEASPIPNYQRQRLYYMNQMKQEIENERNARKLHKNLDERFMDPRHKVPDIIADGEAKYKKMLLDYYQSNNEQEGLNYFDHEYECFNTYNYKHKFLSLNAGSQYNRNYFKTILKH